jgi:hypothetical protein
MRSITIYEADGTISIYTFNPDKMTLAEAATIARELRDIRGHLVSRWSAIVQ